MAKIRHIEGSRRRATSSTLLANLLGFLSSSRVFSGFRRHIQKGSLTIAWPNGRASTFSGPVPGPNAIINVSRWRALTRTFAGGSVGLAEAFIDGDWDSPDLAAVTELGATNRQMMETSLSGSVISRALLRLRHLRSRNTPTGSRRNISFHYDLGNAFYAPWLDSTMTYSGGIWGDDTQSLEGAQHTKYRRLLDLLEVAPGEHILEIGCGWGGFAEFAASEYGARVTGITLSEAQLNFARERLKAAGLQDSVEIRLQDYRDVAEAFDHVASIEMLEAVGEENWPAYFQKVREVLKPEGRAALQVITIDSNFFESYRQKPDFIQAYIFPGGMLPPLDRLRQETAAAGLAWGDEKSFANDYALTLGHWRTRFDAACETGVLPATFDAHFQRIWKYYLAYCEGAFRGGGIDLHQIVLQAPGD